jgi:hypothetical protein
MRAAAHPTTQLFQKKINATAADDVKEVAVMMTHWGYTTTSGTDCMM